MPRRRPNYNPPLPTPDDPAFRVACNEIAEQLSRSWRFKLQIIGIISGALFVLGAAISGIVGWSISASLAQERQRFQAEAQHEMGAAKEAIESEIGEQFKKENVQKTVEAAAAQEASTLLRKQVEPNIRAFQEKLGSNSADVEKRFEKFKQLLEKTEKTATEDVAALRIELQKLQKRNDVTALADKAISDGDVVAYRELEKLAKSTNADERNGVRAELFRVFHAYSMFSGVSRTGGINLNASKINPSKSREEELEVDELLPVLKATEEPLARVKIVELIAAKAKPGSYKTAEALADALKKETHLEVFKVLGSALRATTGYEKGDALDFHGTLDWWDKNKERLQKEDTMCHPPPILSRRNKKRKGAFVSESALHFDGDKPNSVVPESIRERNDHLSSSFSREPLPARSSDFSRRCAEGRGQHPVVCGGAVPSSVAWRC